MKIYKRLLIGAALVTIFAAGISVGYGFDMQGKLSSTKGKSVRAQAETPVTVFGTVRKVESDRITLLALSSPEEFLERQAGVETIIRLTDKTSYKVFQAPDTPSNKPPDSAEKFGVPKPVEGKLRDIKKNTTLLITARINVVGELVAEEIIIEGGR